MFSFPFPIEKISTLFEAGYCFHLSTLAGWRSLSHLLASDRARGFEEQEQGAEIAGLHAVKLGGEMQVVAGVQHENIFGRLIEIVGGCPSHGGPPAVFEMDKSYTPGGYLRQ
jgi:hypothetical protein